MTDNAAAAATPRVPVEERLFSLVLALLATETGLTKHEILSTVQGYRQRYNSSGDNACRLTPPLDVAPCRASRWCRCQRRLASTFAAAGTLISFS